MERIEGNMWAFLGENLVAVVPEIVCLNHTISLSFSLYRYIRKLVEYGRVGMIAWQADVWIHQKSLLSSARQDRFALNKVTSLNKRLRYAKRKLFFWAASRIQIAGRFQGPPKGGTIPIRFPYTSLIIRAFRSSIGKCMGGLPVPPASSSEFLWGLPRTNGNNGHDESWNRYGHCGDLIQLCTLKIDAREHDSFLWFTFLRCFRWLFWVSHSDKLAWNIMFPIRMHNYEIPKFKG